MVEEIAEPAISVVGECAADTTVRLSGDYLLQTLSYTMAKRVYKEWPEAVPSDRIMWGADTVNAEGIYAATEFTRSCIAEALAEKVERGERGELREEHANHIARQIMRDNALKLFPNLKRMLWRKTP